jgi:hypothetical protein
MLTPVSYASTLFDCRIAASIAVSDCEELFKGLEFEIVEEKMK